MRKAWEDTQQKEVFKDLLLIRGANGGKLKFMDMKDLVLKYKQKGYTAVSIDNLYYRLRCYKAVKREEVIGSSITITGRQSTLSDLTSDGNPMNDFTTSSNNITNISGYNNNDADNIYTSTKKVSRPIEFQ